MKKPENTAKDAIGQPKKSKNGSTQVKTEKKKLPEPRGRVVRKENASNGKYVPIGKVVRKT